MSADTPDPRYHTFAFAYRTLTFYGSLSHTIPLALYDVLRVHTPETFLLPVWPLSLSLATTRKISFDFFS